MGKYVAVLAVGKGGMGTVYRGWDTALRRWVALKVLTAGVTGDDVARFWREAQTVAVLRHPGIVNVYDVFSDGGRHVIAMDYIEGGSLAGRRLAPREAARLVAEVARALEHAHAHGVIHRDIKPHNILLDTAGRPFLTDFGLAKHIQSASNSWTAGTVVGTPMYMSPEQAQGFSEQVDARSDVYMLGAVLYEALTGRPPFLGLDAYDTLRRVVDDRVTPPSRLNPEVPPAIEAVTLRCLEKDREKRYGSARELAEGLDRVLAEGTAAPPARKTTRRFPADPRVHPRRRRRPPPG
jgi:serine/threonine-protein kinase